LENNPTVRGDRAGGFFVREKVLCDHLPPLNDSNSTLKKSNRTK
jgi:hypothetical protein